MSWEKNYLKDIKSYSNIYFTFDDGSKGKLIGNWKLDYPSIPCIDDVLLVDGFTTNIMSISQLYDQYFMSTSMELNAQSHIKNILDEWRGPVQQTIATCDKSMPHSCLISKTGESELRHRKHGNLNLKSMKCIFGKKDIE